MYRLLLAVLLCAVIKPALAQAPYINAAVADSEFYKITPADMVKLREINVFMGSRSLGGNIRDGFERLGNEDADYEFMAQRDEASSWGNYDAFSPAAFDTFNWLQNFASPSPYMGRVNEMQTLLETAPWYYQDDIDVFWIQYHICDPQTFPAYSAAMDAMRARNPHIKFVYTTAGVQGPTKTSTDNAGSIAFSDSVRRVYKGNQPIYDLQYILNDDDRCAPYMCDEYTSEDLHPNSDFAEKRMAKGALVLLYKLFIESQPACATTAAPSTPINLAGTYIDRYSTRITFDYSDLPDCGVDHYLVRRNGVQVGTSEGFGYADRGLAEGTDYIYTVAAVGGNDSVSAWSEPCTVSTYNDDVKPTIVNVREIAWADTIVMDFSEALDPTSAATVGNYSIDKGVTVTSAAVVGSVVTLVTSGLSPDTVYTLSVSGVADNSKNANAVAAGTEETITYIVKTIDDVTLHMKLDGNLDDESPNNISSSWNGTASYGAGILGQGIYLNGGTAYPNVSLGSRVAGIQKISMCAWAKKESADTGGRILYRHAVWGLGTSGTGGVAGNLTNYNNDTETASGGTAANDTEWHHYAMTFDGVNILVYLDGQQVGAAAQEGPVVTSSRTVNLGIYPFGGSPFAGTIDEVRMYEFALTPDQVMDIYSQGSGVNADSAAVAAILAANSDVRQVPSISVSDTNGRIIELYLQNDLGGSVFDVTSDIGQLTELTKLHVYGVEDHDHVSPMLTNIDKAIGACTKLTELVIRDNDLTDLPIEITGLTAMTNLDVGNNLLCNVSDTLAGWLTTHDPDWEADQSCAGVAVAVPVISPAAGSYDGQVSVTITCTTSGAEIRYTTDGSDPNGGSSLYSSALNITASSTVTARGFKAGRDSSAAASAAYTILVDTVGPAISTVTAGDSVTVTVVFDEAVNDTDANDESNYTIAGLTVSAASLGGDNMTVTLTVSVMTADSSYTVQVASIRDLADPANTSTGLSDVFTYIDNSGNTIDDVAIYLKFDGNLDDESGNGYSSSWYNGESFGTGIAGQAVDCMAGSSYVRTALPGAVELVDISTITLCAWAKKNAADASGLIIFRHAVSNLSASADGLSGTITSRRSGDYGQRASATVGNDDTDWHHYAVTYDGDSIRVYFDGAYVGSGPQSDMLRDDPGRDFQFGANLTHTLFDGLVDEARIYDWCLSEAQVDQIYQLHAQTTDMDTAPVRMDEMDVISIWPNPVQGIAVIKAAGPVEIYDAGGQLVFTSIETRHVASLRNIQWNGHDISGRQVENGIYYIRAGGTVTKFMYRR